MGTRFADDADQGKRLTLIRGKIVYVRNPLSGHNDDVTADGRFLLIKLSAEEQEPPHLNVVLNWTDELQRRVPAAK